MNQEIRLKLEALLDGELPADQNREVARLLEPGHRSATLPGPAGATASAGSVSRFGCGRPLRPTSSGSIANGSPPGLGAGCDRGGERCGGDGLATWSGLRRDGSPE